MRRTNLPRSRLLMLILLAIMLFNLSFLLIIDSYVVDIEVFKESGEVTSGSTIPIRQRRITSFSAYSTELEIQGCCHVVLFDNLNNRTRPLRSNETFTERITTAGITTFEVQYVNGSFNYTYVVFKENKPLIYLSLPAIIISFLGFTIVIILLGHHLASLSSKDIRTKKEISSKRFAPNNLDRHLDYSFKSL